MTTITKTDQLSTEFIPLNLEDLLPLRHAPPGSFDSIQLGHVGYVNRDKRVSMENFIYCMNTVLKIKNHCNKMMSGGGSSVKKFKDPKNENKLLNLHKRLIESYTGKSFVIQTNLYYGQNHVDYITTPPVEEISHQYLSALKRIHQIEKLATQPPLDELLSEMEKQLPQPSSHHAISDASSTKKSDIDGDEKPKKKRMRINNLTTTRNRKSNTSSKNPVTNLNPNIIEEAYNKLMQSELNSGVLKDQLQGNESFTRQRALNHIRSNNLRLLLLTDDNLNPHQVKMPKWSAPLFQVAPCVLLIKRDPVMGAVIVPSSIVYGDEDVMYLNSMLLEQINGDNDGDALLTFIVYSTHALFESMIYASVEYNVYKPICNTCLKFSPHHIMYAHLYEDIYLNNIDASFAKIYALSQRFYPNTTERLKATMSTIACLTPRNSKAAYVFCVQSLNVFRRLNKEKTILPVMSIGDKTFKSIYESGAEGDQVIAERVMSGLPLNNLDISDECFNYHNQLLASSKNLGTEFYNFSQLNQSLQHIYIDPSGFVMYSVGEQVYNLGHINQFIGGDMIFSDLTEECIENDIVIPVM